MTFKCGHDKSDDNTYACGPPRNRGRQCRTCKIAAVRRRRATDPVARLTDNFYRTQRSRRAAIRAYEREVA